MFLHNQVEKIADDRGKLEDFRALLVQEMMKVIVSCIVEVEKGLTQES